ncbi:IS630 family transposase [Saccharopolyspora shandongensis]|uniref:IS630 family transposase n=1 Tax=Saccharopolyspora shandongensis TaxID=418495 RepID=UPI00343611A9
MPVIANLVQADEDTVRDVIHRFNEIGLSCLDPRWAGGRPRLLDADDEDFVIETATTRPTRLGKPFTRWSVRKLADHLRRNVARRIRIGREALRCLLARRGVTFQRTKTWKESTDPDFDAKLDRIEYALTERPDRTFAFDEFGPLGIRPTAGSCWAERGKPDRVPATFHRTHGVTNSHGCYSVGDDTLWGINRGRKGIGPSWAALKSIRAARPDGAPIYVILDNLSAHKNWRILRWAARNKVELCFTPTNASWANPIEAHFGPLRQFTLANSNHPNHTVQTPVAQLPALAQPERPSPRRPDRPTTRTRPHPQREGHPLGPPPRPSSLITPTGAPSKRTSWKGLPSSLAIRCCDVSISRNRISVVSRHRGRRRPCRAARRGHPSGRTSGGVGR